MSSDHELLLWEHPLSPYAQKVKIALREKGVPFRVATPMGVGMGGMGDFAKASPFGEVPCLVVDPELSIFDSTIMLEYIEEAYPKPDLLPENPRLAAKARMIEEVVDTRLEAVNWALAEIRAFRRAEGAKAAELEARAQEQIAGIHAWLERELAGPWFCPPHFGWADLSVAPYIAGAAGFGFAPPAGSKLADWFARACDRPSVAETLAEARAAGADGGAGLEAARQAVAAGIFKRQYRDHRLEWMMRSGGIDIVLDGIRTGTIRFGSELS